ncbi:MAG TPA: polyprenyl synthetase family protein [Patescibacteria group bacterium]|nr:polyprenyl synthetase family protein [Patescibacteria group bacterium]
MTIQGALKNTASQTEQFLTTFFSAMEKESKLTDTTVVEMTTLLKRHVLRGGKRIRPFLCWCGYIVAGGKSEQAAIHLGSAIELIHFYLLNVDDMADRDTKRHGGPTVEVEYEKSLVQAPMALRGHYARSFSEIASALLFTYAMELFRTVPTSQKTVLEIIGMVNRILIRDTAAGWQIHMHQNWETLEKVSEARFIRGLELVTAQYTFTGPLLMGAKLAENNDSSLTSSLREYGNHVGTAFQIYDDILGLFGDPEQTGKPVGNDVREGKKTLLIQHAYQKASDEDKNFLNNVLGTDISVDELKQVQAIVIQTGALEDTKRLAQEHVDKGLTAIQALPLMRVRTLLEELAAFVISREK